MKKIVFITRNMTAGGAERVIAQIANHFVEKEIECFIVTLDDKEVFYHLNKKIKVYPIGRRSRNKYIDKLQRYWEIRKYVKYHKPDVVLALPEEIGIFVIPTLMGTDIPVVVSERNNPWTMPWKRITRIFRILFYPFSSGIVFQTEQASSFFSSRIRKKSIVLPNPLDLNRIPRVVKNNKRKEVVGVGRLEKQKNFPLLIRSFAKFYQKHPEYRLIIYGEGSLRDELEALATSLLPKGSFSFPGKVSDLLEQINGAYMFVLSSDYEGMPNVIIEAMAIGMPVISTDCPSGGPAELIENDKNGLLVPLDNDDAMSSAMCRLAESKEFAQKIGGNAQEIKVRLNSTIVAEKWRRYLDECSKQ